MTTTFAQHNNYSSTVVQFDEPVMEKRNVGGGGGGKKKKPPLKRQSTFTLEEDEEDWDQNGDLLSGTHHAGGIRAILERANADFVFPEEVKAYISSHFRMIREENDNLRRSLKEKSRQLDKMAKDHQRCGEIENRMEKAERKLKSTIEQLEKEKAKVKNMAKRIKELNNESGGGVEHNIDSASGVLWYGVRPPPQQQQQQHPPIGNNSGNRDAQSPPDEQGYFSRPPSSLATVDLDESSSEKRNPEKKVKALKNQVQAHKEEIDLLNEVHFLTRRHLESRIV